MPFYENQLTAVIDFSSSGDNTIIAAPSSGRIVIDHINVLPTSATVLTLKNGASASLSGPYDLDARQAFALDNVADNRQGLLNCSLATAFIINSGSAVQVSGFVRYRILDKA